MHGNNLIFNKNFNGQKSASESSIEAYPNDEVAENQRVFCTTTAV